MKKRTVFLTTALCVASMAAGVAAGGLITDIKAQLRPDFTIEIDDDVKEFKTADGEPVYPILYEGTTYLPIRAIGEIMGKKVYWYEDEKRIEIKDPTDVTTVTDADVIIDSVPQEKSKNENTAKSEKSKNQNKTKTTVDTSNFIGEEKAKQIALEKASLTEADVVLKKIELDKDNGVWHYEVEFKKDRTEYDADINAEDGTVISWKIDID